MRSLSILIVLFCLAALTGCTGGAPTNEDHRAQQREDAIWHNHNETTKFIGGGGAANYKSVPD